jgi:hypothetical protein
MGIRKDNFYFAAMVLLSFSMFSIIFYFVYVCVIK